MKNNTNKQTISILLDTFKGQYDCTEGAGNGIEEDKNKRCGSEIKFQSYNENK